MQFITHGPDIPIALLQAHEEGRVVFFCGAGISYPAGLLGFKGLVEKIYKLIGTDFEGIERAAFKNKQYDATLNLMEQRLQGQRLALRRKLFEALQPNLSLKGATDTQEALLRLARSREGALRLVTTNFDRVFHTAAECIGQTFQAYAAPMLPIPKNSRWDGLVYLHGLLPEDANDAALNRLVVTSGDFGLAYLIERWAARFVSELFRNYEVCFVGYSINDPVLRYMMDALAADRMLGEATQQAWALGDCEQGEEERKTIEWTAKGVTPILYSVPTGSHNHSALHRTLHAWADTYRDGVQGKEAIVAAHALTRPQESTRQDDFVGRMLWALSDKTGLPAKHFADFNPTPSLDWLLEAFSDKHFRYNDLTNFGVTPHNEVDNKLQFSLIYRPVSYDRAPWMQLASGGNTNSDLDDVMYQLTRWLVRHLDDPRLVIWIAQRGGQVHDRLRWLIEQKLDHIASLEIEGKSDELEELRSQSPNAIPGPLMRTLWRLLLSGRVKTPLSRDDTYRWKDRLKQEPLTTTLRLELRELLAPKVTLKKPSYWVEEASVEEPTDLRQLVDWELVLATDDVDSALNDREDDNWKFALPYLLEDFQQLLRDTMDLLNELGGADDRSDPSHWDLPSITPHGQNRDYRGWVILIELLRDAWLAVRDNNNIRATRIAQTWFELPYPTFKRLALFAASQDDCIPSEQWVDWLLNDEAWWLWATETKREVFRLFVLQGRQLAGTVQERLETAILTGPPREMYQDDLEPEDWKDLVARSIWLHLAKLDTAGLTLGVSAAAQLTKLSVAYPQWQLKANESDEFSSWMSGSGDLDYEESREIDITPRKRYELVQWLKKQPSEPRSFLYEDTWRDVCRTRFFHSLCALNDLAKDGVWPVERWRKALFTWAETDMASRSWRYAAPLMREMPESVMLVINHAFTRWIEAVSKSINRHEEILLQICNHVLQLPLEASAVSRTTRNGIEIHNSVTTAINHPIGHVTQALINLWLNKNPNDNDLLPVKIKFIFSTLCNVQVDRYRHGRVLLGSRLIALYRVDHLWTEQYLLPLLNWDNVAEAKAVWEGFLWSPRLYPPLMIAFKSQFLECANHYDELGEHRQQFAAFLTYAALGPTEGYGIEDFRTAFGTLPLEGLEKAAQALYQSVESAGDHSEDYWKNRAQPFWQQIWPKSRDLLTPRIAASLVRLIIATRGEFPAALDMVKAWLLPIEHPSFIVHRLYESGLAEQFPKEVLQLLNAVITDHSWVPRELERCLEKIVQAEPQLEVDMHYRRLRDYARKSV